MPISIDTAFNIKDNQFWYSKCSFAECIDNKKYITLRITGLGESTLKHAKLGRDGRTTKSFIFVAKAHRTWWREHSHETVQIELLAVGDEVVEGGIQPPNDTKQDEEISKVAPPLSPGKKINKPGKLNPEGSVLCLGLDIAWFGGAANNADSQHDCLGWISFPTNSKKLSQVESGLKRFKLPKRDPNATVLLKEIGELLSTHKNTSRVVFAIDAPIQAYGHRNLPVVRPAKQVKGEVERRACENYLSTKRKLIDKAADGSNGWHPQIQPGAPLAHRILCLLKGLKHLGFELWKKEMKHSEKLVIECFPAEAIWAMKRLGFYPENLTAKEVKAYKKQSRKLLTAEQVRTLVGNVLNAFAKSTGVPGIWKEFLKSNLLEWMLQDTTWQNSDYQYRGGKLLDDVVDTAICLATSVSYTYGEFHTWQDESCPEDGHIFGPGAIESLLRD